MQVKARYRCDLTERRHPCLPVLSKRQAEPELLRYPIRHPRLPVSPKKQTAAESLTGQPRQAGMPALPAKRILQNSGLPLCLIGC